MVYKRHRYTRLSIITVKNRLAGTYVRGTNSTLRHRRSSLNRKRNRAESPHDVVATTRWRRASSTYGSLIPRPECTDSTGAVGGHRAATVVVPARWWCGVRGFDTRSVTWWGRCYNHTLLYPLPSIFIARRTTRWRKEESLEETLKLWNSSWTNVDEFFYCK